MDKFRNIQKGLITTLFGLLMLGIVAHRYIETGEVDFVSVIGALGGAGFLFTKDQRASHTK